MTRENSLGFNNITADICPSYSLHVLQLNFERTSLIFWTNIITCALNGITCVTAVGGNALVLIAILSSSMRRQPCMIVLCSLAMADFLVGLLVQPSYVVYKAAEINQQWDAVCYIKLVHVTVGFTTTGVSLMSLMAIAVDRLLAVRLHLRYIEIVTTRRVKIVIACLWIISISNSTLQFVEKDIFQAIVLIMELLSIVIASLAYQKVYKIVQKHRKEIQKAAPNCKEKLDVERYRKSAMTMFVVFMFSLFCYLPFSVYIALEAVYGFTPSIKALANIATTIICMISSFNPCIYCFRIHEIRAAVWKLLRRRRTVSITVPSNGSNPSNLSNAR